uniref:Trehalase n=1 Tax=Globodera pallida TaxID=36090 RepID=A0A183CDB4_GLOPA
MNGKGNQKNSLIYVSNPFMVPGGRFREFRYWDAYLIARGLIASGWNRTTSVKNMCKNFAEMVNRFGFVPTGGRIYYNKRSQPPFLTLMVYDYFGATGDIKFLKEIFAVDVKGREKTFYQYRADTNMPRPEAFCQDVDLVKNISDPKEKAKIWHNIANWIKCTEYFMDHWLKGAKVFIGPEVNCRTEASMAAAQNLPLILHKCKGRTISDKKKCIRICAQVPAESAIARSFMALLGHFRWR